MRLLNEYFDESRRNSSLVGFFAASSSSFCAAEEMLEVEASLEVVMDVVF